MSNILPKKSWHVYNKENREKVRKDEEKEERAVAELEERKFAAESEDRLRQLREKVGIKEDFNIDKRSKVSAKHSTSDVTIGSIIKSEQRKHERRIYGTGSSTSDNIKKHKDTEDPLFIIKKAKQKRI